MFSLLIVVITINVVVMPSLVLVQLLGFLPPEYVQIVEQT